MEILLQAKELVKKIKIDKEIPLEIRESAQKVEISIENLENELSKIKD